MPQIIETFIEFKARMSCEFVIAGTQISPRTAQDVSRIVFANGGVSDGHIHFDPPTHPRTLLLIRKEFVLAKLRNEEEDFKSYRDHCLLLAANAKRFPNLPGAPTDAPELLNAGAKRIGKLREELAAIDAQLIDKDAVRLQQEQQEREYKRLQQQTTIEQQILNVRI